MAYEQKRLLQHALFPRKVYRLMARDLERQIDAPAQSRAASVKTCSEGADIPLNV